MPTIDEITTLATNADKEQLPITTAVELKNLRPVNGKLVKTNGFGKVLDTGSTAVVATPTIANYIFTYVDSDFTTGKLYIAVSINSSQPNVIIYGYDDTSSAWITLNTGSDTAAVNGKTFNIPANTAWNHANLENPVIQLGRTLRLYPGNNSDTSSQADLVLIQPIDRKYYDGNYVPTDSGYTADYYGVSGDLTKPALTFTVSQLQGGDKGTFTPSSTDIDARFYRFAYLYDGIQESLLSDQIGVTYDESIDMFGKFQFTVDRTTQDKRITGLKMYRATDDDSAQELIQTVDFLRDSADTGVLLSQDGKVATTGAHIPGVTMDFDSSAGPFKIFIGNDFGGSSGITLSPTPSTGDTEFTWVGTGSLNTEINEDLWNAKWRIEDQSATLPDDENTLGGAYAGINTVILPNLSTDLSLNNYSGGVLEGTNPNVNNTNVSTTGTSASVDGEEILTLTTPTPHFLEAGNIINFSGFTSTNLSLNGRQIVKEVPTGSRLTFTIEIEISGGLGQNGTYQKQQGTHLLDANVGKAVHSSENWAIRSSGALAVGGYNLLDPVKGLYFPTLSTNDITYTIYDPNLIGLGEFAPHQEVKFSEVNGKFAIDVQGRLFQYNVTLNPNSTDSSKAESQPDWLLFSDLDQPDMMPVDNLNTFRIQSQEGGEGTGLAELFGNVVAMKPHSLTTVYLNNTPDDATQWYLKTSAFNVGNIAPNGYITVRNNLYVIYHNGIYRFRLNDLAEANESSVKDFRISELINDIFEALTTTQKEAVRSVFDAKNQEILFTFNTRCFAWNIQFQSWREVTGKVGFFGSLEFADVGTNPSVGSPSTGNNVLFSLDKDGETIVYPFQTTSTAGLGSVVADMQIRSTSVDESGPVSVQSKTFTTTDMRPQVVRYLNITYKAATTIDVEIYTEKGGLDPSINSPLKTIELPATSEINGARQVETYRTRISVRAEKYNIRIADGANTDAVEIHKILITNKER
jgi:hypothetical protein